jgi:arylsulfatase A-like enzyme
MNKPRPTLIGLIAILGAISTLPTHDAQAAPLSRPNIVFIIADDLGWADVGFHGGNVATPNLRKLLDEGVELRQHYVAPVCSPTRTGFMTGRYWSRFGITTPTNNLALPFGTETVASALNKTGYETCITGKWHLGSKPAWGPNHFGFDHSYGSMAGGVTPWSHFYKKGPYSTTWHRNEKLLTEEGHVTDLLANEAVQWIQDRSGDKPFFLYLPFTAVHLPIREPQAWLDRVPKEISGDVPRHYAACVLHLDDAVGRIVAALDKAGQTANTLVVFTSDNGGSTAENNDSKYPNDGDDCPNGPLPGNNLPLRGKKGDLYEGGTRVPTIARWPGKIPAGSTCGTPVHIVDWMPTFCALAGAKANAEELNWDGLDIWPALSGQGTLPQRSLYSAGPLFRSQALRDGDWKLIVFRSKDGKEDKTELFNIASDPNEKTDLFSSRPEKATELKKKLQSAASSDLDAVAKGD